MKTKKCSRCGEIKPLVGFCKDRAKKDGYQGYCKECNKLHCKKYKDTHKAGCTKRRQNWRKTKPGKEAKRRWQLKGKYDITPDEHQLMYILQGGRCKICKQATAYDEIKVDHCHKSGKIRGLLCGTCNTGLGMLKDNPQILANAIEYLKRTR